VHPVGIENPQRLIHVRVAVVELYRDHRRAGGRPRRGRVLMERHHPAGGQQCGNAEDAREMPDDSCVHHLIPVPSPIFTETSGFHPPGFSQGGEAGPPTGGVGAHALYCLYAHGR